MKNLIIIICLFFGLNSIANDAKYNAKSVTTLQTVVYPDVTICQGSSTILDAGCGFDSYLWSTGATGQTINVSTSGTYNVQVNYSNGFSYIKQFNVIVTNLPFTLGPDVYICTGNTTQLDAGSNFTSYLWSNGQTSQSINVGIGTYNVTITDPNGCTATDNVSVIKSTHCTTVPCGNMYKKLNSYTTAVGVSGTINYRFRFYDVTNPTVIAGERTQPSNYIYFNQVPGLRYDHQYFWTVELEYATGVFGPPSKQTCTITFLPAETTMSSCGSTYHKINSYTTASPISGVSMYRFTFYDVNNPTVQIAQKDQVSNYLYFDQVGGLQYDHQYIITVSVQYNPGTGAVWGPASSSSCIYSFSDAQTIFSSCGMTYTNLSSTYSTAQPVTGALHYEFTFYDVLYPTVQVDQKVQTSNYIYYNQVSGLQMGHSYIVTVRVEYSNGLTIQWGAPSSSSCIITFDVNGGSGQGNVSDNSTDNSNKRANIINEEIGNDQFTLTVFPNPSDAGVVSFEVSGTEETSLVSYCIYDTFGKIIFKKSNAQVIESIDTSHLSSGVYLLKAIVNGKEISQRVVIK